MKKAVWFVLVLIALMVSACGPAMVPDVSPETESGEMFMVALPRIVLDFDQNGVPSILGVTLEDLGKFAGADLSTLRIDKTYMDWLASSNLQNIEVRQTGNGIALLANGVLMPHIGWSDDSLAQASQLATFFNIQGEDLIKKLMPAVRRLGLNLAVTFPPAAGAEVLALADPNVAMTKAAPTDEPPSALVRIEIKYDDQGVPAILGISAAELASLGIQVPVALSMDWVRTLQAYDIQNMELQTRWDGLFIYMNGNVLPNLVWDNALLSSAADLYAEMQPTSQYIDWVKTIVPLIDNADIDVLIHFPVAAGATPIPAKMHAS
jgi:hypothetical protein